MNVKWTTETQTYEAAQHTGSCNPWDFFTWEAPGQRRFFGFGLFEYAATRQAHVARPTEKKKKKIALIPNH